MRRDTNLFLTIVCKFLHFIDFQIFHMIHWHLNRAKPVRLIRLAAANQSNYSIENPIKN